MNTSKELIVLRGTPGAGKTTNTEKHFKSLYPIVEVVQLSEPLGEMDQDNTREEEIEDDNGNSY